jgi:hypothetical protein
METQRIFRIYSNHRHGIQVTAKCDVLMSERLTNMFHRLLTSAVLLSCLCTPVLAQLDISDAPSTNPPTWHAGHVKHLIGFENTLSNTNGDLTISPGYLVFLTSTGLVRVARDEITEMSVGDERVETGGFAGKAARIAIPYGGGAALGTVTQKQVGLLTVGYRDKHHGLHTAVFQLPKDDATEAKASLMVGNTPIRPRDARAACPMGQGPRTLSLKKIGTGEGTVVPSEFEAVLYESLLATLHEKSKGLSIYRDGDRSGACRSNAAVIKIERFSKGNAAVRASTGPLGLFVGVTRLRVSLQVIDANGLVRMNEVIKATRRGDRESLDAAKSIGKDAGKRLAKRIKKAA